jgi:hypothetical protein
MADCNVKKRPELLRVIFITTRLERKYYGIGDKYIQAKGTGQKTGENPVLVLRL